MKYDCLVIGAGLSGCTAARLLADAGKKVLVIALGLEAYLAHAAGKLGTPPVLCRCDPLEVICSPVGVVAVDVVCLVVLVP